MLLSRYFYSLTRKLRCCGAQLLRNFCHKFSATFGFFERNFLEGTIIIPCSAHNSNSNTSQSRKRQLIGMSLSISLCGHCCADYWTGYWTASSPTTKVADKESP